MMQGVLVSVSVVVYTRILVSDRVGACLCRPFSNFAFIEHLNAIKIIVKFVQATIVYLKQLS